MCGIVGVVSTVSNQHIPSELQGREILATLEHRGPDDGGLWIDRSAMLGHRRLAILDLSEEGRQPMSDVSGRYWVTFNGEIYNYRELRSELQSLGHRFRSQSDTEVLLNSYVAWGEDFLDRLNGMFAFAIWDRLDKRLFLARDHAGIKPLFYHSNPRWFGFASEIKALLAIPGMKAQLDPQTIHSFLTFGYVPCPDTGFEGIKQVPAGHFLTLYRGQLRLRRWYRLPYPESAPVETLKDACEKLDVALQNATNRQMVSDVPLGAFLSGGLDSSAVVRAMRGFRATNEVTGVGDIHTFSIGFEDPSFDESPYAARVAEIYGTKHRAEHFRESSIESLLDYVYHAEDPLADNSMLPLFLLSQSTSRHVKVALSGDGADELLAGYDTYRATELAARFRQVPTLMRRLTRSSVQWLPSSGRKYDTAAFAQRFLKGAELPFPKDHASWRRMVDPELASIVYSPDFLASVEKSDPLDRYIESMDMVPSWADSLTQQLHLDLQFHLPNDMLVKVDRMSMAHSLEVRVPWLDREVIEACLAMPSDVKRVGKKGKLVLKELLETDLPRSLTQRRKSGFVIPIEQWLRGGWNTILRESLNEEFCDASGIFRWDGVRRLIDEHSTGKKDHAYSLFTMLIFALWYGMWVSKTISYRPHRRREIKPISFVRVKSL